MPGSTFDPVSTIRTAVGWLGLALIALSVVSLIEFAYDLSFISLSDGVLQSYESLLNLLFGWAEPILREQLAIVSERTGAELDLYPHWKHAFVVLLLFFGSDTIAKLQPREIDMPLIDKVWSFGTGLLGLGLAALCGVAAGAMPTESRTQDFGFVATVLTVATFTLFWFVCILRDIVIYGWGQNFSDDYGRSVRAGVGILIIGAVLVALGYFVVSERMAGIRTKNLAFIALFLGEVALYSLVLSLWERIATGEGPQSLWEYPEDRIGFIGLNTFIVCGVVGAFLGVSNLVIG